MNLPATAAAANSEQVTVGTTGGAWAARTFVGLRKLRKIGMGVAGKRAHRAGGLSATELDIAGVTRQAVVHDHACT